MHRIIIENRSWLPMTDAVYNAWQVMRLGRISKTSAGDQYCFATVFNDGTVGYASRNKASDKITIADDPSS